MSFLLYKESGPDTWDKIVPPEEFARGDEVKLATVFRKVAEGKWHSKSPDGEDFFWEADRQELLKVMGLDSKHHLVIDLKPGRKISLYEIVWVMGASHEKWTPLLLRLEALFVDYMPPKMEEWSKKAKERIKELEKKGLKEKAEKMKENLEKQKKRCLRKKLKKIDLKEAEESFKNKDDQGFRALIHETLYLRGGYNPFKNWRWGAIGQVNGTLLWPRVARRFAEEIIKATNHLR